MTHEFFRSGWVCARLIPPGWEARLYGRQDARRYRRAEQIHFDGAYSHRDIAAKALTISKDVRFDYRMFAHFESGVLICVSFSYAALCSGVVR